MKTLKRYCSCGGQVSASSSIPDAAADIVAQFDRIHSGDGHEATTPDRCRRARRRQDEEELARWENGQ